MAELASVSRLFTKAGSGTTGAASAGSLEAMNDEMEWAQPSENADQAEL
jgi:hypothetical protein